MWIFDAPSLSLFQTLLSLCNVGSKVCHVIYIPWLRGVYQQYETRALRYLPEAKPRADIEGRGSHIADTHREDMVHIIYSIAYCNIKLHNCPPLLLGPFRLPPGSVLALKKTNFPIAHFRHFFKVGQWQSEATSSRRLPGKQQ